MTELEKAQQNLAEAEAKVREEKEKIYREFVSNVTKSDEGIFGLCAGTLVIFRLVRKGRYKRLVAFPVFKLDEEEAKRGAPWSRRDLNIAPYIEVNSVNFTDFTLITEPENILANIRHRTQKEVEKIDLIVAANWN